MSYEEAFAQEVVDDLIDRCQKIYEEYRVTRRIHAIELLGLEVTLRVLRDALDKCGYEPFPMLIQPKMKSTDPEIP